MQDISDSREHRASGKDQEGISAAVTKKVLFLVGAGADRIGGVEVFVREAAVQLRRRGVYTIAAFHSRPTPSVQSFFDVDGLTVEWSSDLREGAWSGHGAVRSMLKRHRPDILHWQFLDVISPYPWLGRWYGASQVFFTNQASYAEGYSPRRTVFWKRIIARIINWPLTGMFCVSNYSKDLSIASRVISPSRVHCIYNAVTLPCLEDSVERAAGFRQKYRIPETAPVVIQVSWLIPEKGLEDLLHAAKLVRDQYPAARFVIAGEGPDRARLEKLGEDLGIADSVIWTGFLENPTQCGLFDAADIICQLSRWEEAFGYVIAEGMSFGKPVIATSVGGIPEVVTHEETGFLSPRRDPLNAAQNICRLLGDPSLRRRFGEAGRRMVEEKFSVTDRVRDLLGYYDVPAENQKSSQRVCPESAVETADR